MRELEFRGKATYNNEWVYGNYIHSKRFAGSLNEFRIHNQETGLESDIEPDTVGQYTGLKDANDVKIFEGDIVEVYDKYNQVWVNGCVLVTFSYDYVGGWVLLPKGSKQGLNIGTRTETIRVVGNIYDNPELLEVQS